MKPQLTTLPVASLEVCDRTRVRQQKPKDGSDVVLDYVEAYQNHLIVEPLDVFREKGTERYIVADGEHRLLALRRAKITKVECRLHEGDEIAALDFATGCNQKHGLRRTDRDKYHALVRIMETSLRDTYRTDTELSEKIGVSIATIKRYRAQWRSSDGGDSRVRARKKQAKAKAEKHTSPPKGNGSREPFQAADKSKEISETTRNCDSESRVSNTSARSVKGAVMNPPESAAQGSEAGNRNTPIGVDAGRVRPPVPAPEPEKAPEPDLMPEPEPLTADEIAAMDEEARESRTGFAEKIMAEDDRIAAAAAEVERLTRELAQMRHHRDHWMNQAGANAKFAKGLQRKFERVNRQLAAKDEEIEKLRERVAIMESEAA